MPFGPDEEFAQGSEEPDPVTPTKQPSHAGACHDYPDAKTASAHSNGDEEFRLKKKRLLIDTKKQERHLAAFEAVKRWNTGNRADADNNFIQVELK
jgi:hypothetical protein